MTAHRFDVDLADALGVAALVRAPGVSLEQATRLIQQYARTVAAGAALDATGEAIARFDRAFTEAFDA